MTNTNARTNKARKTNRKFIATLCAVLAATAMVTGIAVFTVSASVKDDNKIQPASSSQTVNEKTTDSSSKTSTAQQAAMQAVQSMQAEQAVKQQAQVQAQVAQQAPAQVQVAQQAPAQVQVAQQAPAQVQVAQEAPVQAQEVQQAAPAQTQDNKLYIPQGEVNDWKIHNAKDGFPIGSYFNGKSVLYVNKLDNANYAITVTIPNDDNTATVYNINAVANGSKMYYSYAAKSTVEYDANGNIVNAIVLDNNHQGTFDASDAGYTWVDTEGTTVFVPWIGYPIG